MATAACWTLAIARSPADCQDSATGSQDRTEVRLVKASSQPPVM